MSSPTQGSTLLALSQDLATAVEQAGSAVVTINGRKRMSSSGVHWRSGVIVTADYTIRREEDISVTLPDGATVSATLAGRDSSTDLAILRLEAPLPVAPIGDSASLKVGNLVLALGRSGESGVSASLGIVSAMGGAWRNWCGGQIDQFLRLDINLYPGYAGGPLLDAAGRVVGINTLGPRRMVLTIPTTTVNRVVEQLLTKGRIIRGYLGLSMQPVRLPEDLKQTLNLSTPSGVIVVNVEPNAAAAAAGILLGDVLVALNGTPVTEPRDVQAILSPERVGQTLTVSLIRGGTAMEVQIVVGERPE